MTEKHIDIRFTFTEKTEDDEYTYLELKKIERTHTDIEGDGTAYISEAWAQSDGYHIGIANGLLDVIDGEVYTERD